LAIFLIFQQKELGDFLDFSAKKVGDFFEKLIDCLCLIGFTLIENRNFWEKISLKS
jgi:hypothetical protein